MACPNKEYGCPRVFSKEEDYDQVHSNWVSPPPQSVPSLLPNTLAHGYVCEYLPIRCSECDQKISKIGEQHHKRLICARRKVQCAYCHRSFDNAAIESHTRGCTDAFILCPCGQTVHKEHLAPHQDSCPKALKTCIFCSSGVVASDFAYHEKECNLRQVTCEYCYKSDILYKMIDSHYRTCPNKFRKCLYADIGCHFEASNFDMELHEKEHSEHLNLIISACLSLKHSIEGLDREMAEASRTLGICSTSCDGWNNVAIQQKSELQMCKLDVDQAFKTQAEIKRKHLESKMANLKLDLEPLKAQLEQKPPLPKLNPIISPKEEDLDDLQCGASANPSPPLSVVSTKSKSRRRKPRPKKPPPHRNSFQPNHDARSVRSNQTRDDSDDTDEEGSKTAWPVDPKFVYERRNIYYTKINRFSELSNLNYIYPITRHFTLSGYIFVMQLEHDLDDATNLKAFGLSFQLRSGPLDEELKWPCPVKFYVELRDGFKRSKRLCTIGDSDTNPEYFQRPTEYLGSAWCSKFKLFTAGELSDPEHEYITNDTFMLCFRQIR